ncbi:MAG: RHS repeat-associated core domain-containing protein [Chloroflexi bacterium]|nr:RHS repeat-associated core domain-containing protein [Chloroflexota bacterium]
MFIGLAYNICSAGALTKPHAVTSAGADTYCYDKNGNMVKRVENGTTFTQDFDAENRLSSVITGGVTTTFVYDGDGNLVKKVKGTTTTVYVGTYEVELTNSVVTKKTSYYPGGAMRVDIVGGSNTLYYSLKDHLGSASVLLDSSGNLVTNGEQRYYPFGESRIVSADLKTNHLFTGQLSMGTELGGIYSYGARFYSAKLGRFLSADTIVPEPGDPQALNRFSYVKNNPLKYTDPTGHTYADCDTFAEGRNDAYVNPDGGVFSRADCWAYNARQNQVQSVLDSFTNSGNLGELVEAILLVLESRGGPTGESLAKFFREFSRPNAMDCGAEPDRECLLSQFRVSTCNNCLMYANATEGMIFIDTAVIKWFAYSELEFSVLAGAFGHEIDHLRDSNLTGTFYGEILAYRAQWRIYEAMGLGGENIGATDAELDKTKKDSPSYGVYTNAYWGNETSLTIGGLKDSAIRPLYSHQPLCVSLCPPLALPKRY